MCKQETWTSQAHIQIAYWTEASLATLFKVFVSPHLEYCIQACTPTLRRDIETLEKVQRRATRLVPSLRNVLYEDRLRWLNLPTLEERRKRGDLIGTFKILKQHDQVDPHNFFIIREDAIGRENTRGHHLKIFKQGRNTVQRRKLFSHRVVDTWNDLPREVIEATTVNGFKGRLDKYIGRERRGAITGAKLCTKSFSIYSVS